MGSSLQEIIDRVMTGATGINNDALQSILADAEMTAETLFMVSARRVIWLSAEVEKNIEDFSQTHYIVIDAVTGIGTLPASLMREFIHLAELRDYQFAAYKKYQDYARFRFNSQICYYTIKDGELHTTCTLSNGTLVRTIASVEKEAMNAEVVAAVGSGGFADLADIGRRIAIFSGSTQSFYDTIKGVVSADICEILGHLNTIIAAGDKVAKIYDPVFAHVRTIATMSKAPADQTITSGVGQGGGTAADVGRLLIIRNDVSGEIVMRAIITAVNTPDSFEIHDYTAAFGGFTNVEIYEILEPGVNIHTPTLPILPDDIADPIEMASEKYLDLIVADMISILTGDMPLKNLKPGF